MQKNFFLIIFINLIIIFLITEAACYFYNVRHYKKKPAYSLFKIQSFDKVYEMIKREKLRKPIGLQYKNRPILLLGCSYAYGYKLDNKETLAYLLSEKMKRPLYNRAFEWNWGLNTMLYQSRREDFYKEVPNPEYIIYVFTSDHREKANCSSFDPIFPYPSVRYISKNGKLEKEKFPFRYNLHMFRTYSEYKVYKYSQEYLDNSANSFFIQTKKEFDKHWKNYKFIILIYERDKEYIKSEHKNWEELVKQGFTVISTTDLTGGIMDKKEYFISDNYHPSKQAWNVIVPNLIKKLEEIK